MIVSTVLLVIKYRKLDPSIEIYKDTSWLLGNTDLFSCKLCAMQVLSAHGYL